jgi:hypothetical protein
MYISHTDERCSTCLRNVSVNILHCVIIQTKIIGVWKRLKVLYNAGVRSVRDREREKRVSIYGKITVADHPLIPEGRPRNWIYGIQNGRETDLLLPLYLSLSVYSTSAPCPRVIRLPQMIYKDNARCWQRHITHKKKQ